MDLAEYRKLSHDTWEQMAAAWDEWTDVIVEQSRAPTEQMVAALSPRPGETILELASGAGVGGFAAAAAMGGEGRLIMTDFAEQMVVAMRRRGADLGFDNIEYRVMDAEQMDIDDDSVDGVLCRWGYMLMADPAAALRETRRVLRPGGRLSFSVWGAPEDNPWGSVPSRVLLERGHLEPPENGAPGIFALGDAGRIDALVTGAGFERPQLEEVRLTWNYVDFAHFWSFITEAAGGIALVFEQLDARETAEVRADIETRLEQYKTGGGYDMPGACINGLTR
ncbi:MAG TPA: class I SAM-dependent methyltransferase [Thermoleophilaceae bacterium]